MATIVHFVLRRTANNRGFPASSGGLSSARDGKFPLPDSGNRSEFQRTKVIYLFNKKKKLIFILNIVL